jgi:glycosyltransferase involved in cell wall biosynthesis
MTPLVSVVVPSYDRPRYLHEAVASVIAQTYRNLEIIVSDNASPTDPGPALASFGDPRIRLCRNACNLGVGGNIAAGLRKCAGKYAAILGDDDLWHPEFLSTLVAALERHPQAVVAFCDHDIIDEQGVADVQRSNAASRRFGRDILREGLHRPFGEIALVRRSICVMSGAVLRRDAASWAALPAEVALGADLYLAYLAARTGGACYYCRRRLAHYRFHRTSLTVAIGADMGARLANARAALFCWSRFGADVSLGESRRYFEMKRAINALRIVAWLLRRGEVGAACRELGAFLRCGLWRPRILIDAIADARRLRRARA